MEYTEGEHQLCERLWAGLEARVEALLLGYLRHKTRYWFFACSLLRSDEIPSYCRAERLLDKNNLQLWRQHNPLLPILQYLPLILWVFGQLLQTDIPFIILQLNQQHLKLTVVELFPEKFLQLNDQNLLGQSDLIDKGIVRVNDHQRLLVLLQNLVDVGEWFRCLKRKVVLGVQCYAGGIVLGVRLLLLAG